MILLSKLFQGGTDLWLWQILRTPSGFPMLDRSQVNWPLHASRLKSCLHARVTWYTVSNKYNWWLWKKWDTSYYNLRNYFSKILRTPSGFSLLYQLQVNWPLHALHRWKALFMLLLRYIMCRITSTDGFGEKWHFIQNFCYFFKWGPVFAAGFCQ